MQATDRNANMWEQTLDCLHIVQVLFRPSVILFLGLAVPCIPSGNQICFTIPDLGAAQDMHPTREQQRKGKKKKMRRRGRTDDEEDMQIQSVSTSSRFLLSILMHLFLLFHHLSVSLRLHAALQSLA